MSRTPTRFCPKGHDKDAGGRRRNGACRECDRTRDRARDRKRDPRFCIHGHDKSVVGTVGNGECAVCKKARNQAQSDYRKLPCRFPAEPLVTILTHRGVTHFAHAMNISGSTWARWRDTGLTLEESDRAACRLGHHPYELWPNWYDAQEPADVA